MFTDFLYILRGYGMKTSLNEWTGLMDALDLNLNEASLTEFYHGKGDPGKESDYDRFDQAFLEYFKNVKEQDCLPEALQRWLSRAMTQTPFDREEADAQWGKKNIEEIRRLMEQRLAEQKEQHHGGNKWIGTGGTTAFGHSGYAQKGIRVHGSGMSRSALKVAGERNYRDFREDKVLQLRQFQIALRKLRLLSSKDDGARTELNVTKSIEKTCDRGGRLELVLERPRKNQTKLLLLMDSGGSMWAYADLCNRLFQAVNQASQFKDLKIYYFHNCFYDQLFTAPQCKWEDKVSTEWVLHNLKPEYKVIVVGDATMGPAELLEPGGTLDYDHENDKAGIDWIKTLKKRFTSAVWLNPLHEKLWDYDASTRTIQIIREQFPMFPLTVQGLEAAIKELRKGEAYAPLLGKSKDGDLSAACGLLCKTVYKRRKKIGRELSRRGGLACGAEGDGGSEYTSAYPADNSLASHGHGDNRRLLMFFAHGESGVQKCEDIPLILRHYGIFGDIGSQMLHLAETAHNCLLRWRRGGAVAGSYNFHPGAVAASTRVLIVSSLFGQFNVNQIQGRSL